MDDIYGIIPVSKFKECKTRLSPFLSEDEREKLLKVMLKDVTDTLRKYTDKIIIILYILIQYDYTVKFKISQIVLIFI